jgi:hypothetical protein
MANDRRRILELALESLENKKKELDAEIAQITRELRGRAGKQTAIKEAGASTGRKGPRFSKEEKLKRSKRMTEYWANRRKEKTGKKE